MNKGHPILFSAEMVRAILEGRKTQTRRVIKNILPTCQKIEHSYGNEWAMHGNENGWIITCPYGVPGDLLWVREAWAMAIDAGASIHAKRAPVYKADGEIVPRWRPSIHMPRWASRIALEIVNIHVERVQDITPMDCISEGIARSIAEAVFIRADEEREKYHRLWDQLNAARGYGWEVNPWVWVVEFRRLK